ncbi:MAG: hypothetical protein ACRD3V_06575 [Vicinamibacteria bacterium]
MLLALAALLAGAGGEVLESRLRASIEEGPDVAVRLDYQIRLPEDAYRVSFSALEIGDAAVESFSASASGVSLPVEIEPRSGRMLRGVFEVPKGSVSPIDIELRYVVRNGAVTSAGDIRASLPLPILELSLADTGSTLFVAAVDLPPGLRIVDGFPSNSRAEAEGLYRWELPLVPTFLSFRATSGSGFLSPPRLASTALVVLLVVAGFVGIKRARAMKP